MRVVSGDSHVVEPHDLWTNKLAGSKYADRAPVMAEGAAGFEFRIVRKNGEVEWVSNSWQPIYGTDGAFLGLRLSFNSIQALKDVELDLRHTLTAGGTGVAVFAADYHDLDGEGRPYELSYLLTLVFVRDGEHWLLLHDQNTLR